MSVKNVPTATETSDNRVPHLFAFFFSSAFKSHFEPPWSNYDCHQGDEIHDVSAETR